jgi:acyl-coenzyme A synthetase/AMP-(fatty) acid ligase
VTGHTPDFFTSIWNRPFLCQAGEVVTFGEFFQWQEAQSAVGPHQQWPNGGVVLDVSAVMTAFPWFYFLLTQGCSVVPVHGPGALGWLGNDSGHWQTFLQPQREGYTAKPLKGQDTLAGQGSFLALFTSGTSGHRRLVYHHAIPFLRTYQPYFIGRQVLVYFPLHHISGVDALLRSLYHGNTVHVPQSISVSDIVECLAAHAMDTLLASPSLLGSLLLSGLRGSDLPALERVYLGADACPSHVLKQFEARFPGVRVYNRYASTELGTALTRSASNPRAISFRDAGSYKVRQGALFVRKPLSLHCIQDHGKPPVPVRNVWWETGDFAMETSEGLVFDHRREDRMVVGGEKVLAGEIEAAIALLDWVGQCRAYAVDNELLGQAVGLDIVLRQNIEYELVKALVRQHCIKLLPPSHMPVQLRVLKELPSPYLLKKVGGE